MTEHIVSELDYMWLELLRSTFSRGGPVNPRGMKTLELRHHTVSIDMRRPVLMVPERKLSYQFMAAEAYWILSGSNKVSSIAPWNKNISQFSDDGVVFAGAYGPRIAAQLEYVTQALLKDPDTRQATMTIWTPSPGPSKDIPCTVAVDFKVRGGELNCHVFMRSSDQWMGLPYDLFNFSMLSHLVCGLVNTHEPQRELAPGRLYLTAASSHLYETQWEAARELITLPVGDLYKIALPPRTPKEFFQPSGHLALLATLEMLRDTKPGDPLRWWEAQS